MGIPFTELLLRLLLTFILCGMLGLERESRGEAAGLRTHLLVGLGAALFTLVSAYGFQDVEGPRDPARISAQIVTGIGFLGAGAIMREGFGVRGLTTAAALWVAAAIGMACAAGYYVGALLTTAIVMPSLIVFLRMRPLVQRRLRSHNLEMEADLKDGMDAERLVVLMEGRGVYVDGADVVAKAHGEHVRLQLRIPPGVHFAPLLREVAGLEGVRRCSASGMHQLGGRPVGANGDDDVAG
ncbi:MAG: MgtC/SapB family protein [Acidimicrobiales bacterium]